MSTTDSMGLLGPPQAGKVFTYIGSVRPRAGELGFTFSISLYNHSTKESALAEVSATDLMTYAGTCKSISKKYGAWLMVEDVADKEITWANFIGDRIQPQPETAAD